MYNLQNLVTECSSKGCLSKGWYVNERGERVLVKGNTFNNGLTCYEPYSEVMSSIVARHLGLAHVEYTLAPSSMFPDIECNLKHVSLCKELRAPVGYTRYSAYKLLLLFSKKARVYDFWYYFLNLPIDFRSSCDMFVFDAIIGNVDRHLNNWDYFVKLTSSGVDIQLAPIFDSGDSLLASVKSLNPNLKLGCDLSKPFKTTHNKQLALIKRAFPEYKLKLNPEVLWQGIVSEIQPILNLLPEKRAACVRRYLHNRLCYYSAYMRGD